MSEAWKAHERKVAKSLGGRRNSRGGDFSQSVADVQHSLFSIECKYRQKLPRLLRLGLDQAKKYDENKIALLVLKEKYSHGSMVCLKMSDFTGLFGILPEQPE